MTDNERIGALEDVLFDASDTIKRLRREVERERMGAGMLEEKLGDAEDRIEKLERAIKAAWDEV